MFSKGLERIADPKRIEEERIGNDPVNMRQWMERPRDSANYEAPTGFVSREGIPALADNAGSISVGDDGIYQFVEAHIPWVGTVPQKSDGHTIGGPVGSVLVPIPGKGITTLARVK